MNELKTLSNFLQLDDIVSGTSKDLVFFDVEVLKLYYEILEQVEKDSFRYWNIGSLRNYLWAFYTLSNTLSGSYRQQIEEKNFSKMRTGHAYKDIIGVNVFVGDNYALFFTGLYSKQRKNGLKEGLYILCQKKDKNIERKVFTHSKLLSYNSDISRDLNRIRIEATFETELMSDFEFAPKTLSDINLPLKFDYNAKDIDELKSKKEELLKNRKGNNLTNNWLHILIDGVDNVPTDFLKLLYESSLYRSFSAICKMRIVVNSILNKSEGFARYETYMRKAIENAIEKSRNDMKFTQLPLNYFMNNKGNDPFQYLLPIDLTNTGNPDFCACVSVCKNGDGELKTILNMNEVYGNGFC